MAFLASWAAEGWRPGDDVPSGPALLAASGAAFATVVFAQKANAFCCRSASAPLWAGRLGSNRMLLGAAAFELGFAAVLLLIDPVAEFFEQGAPPAAGWLVALASMPVIVIADAAVKRAAGRRRS